MLARFVYSKQTRLLTIFKLRMSVEEVFTSPDGMFSCSDRFPYPVKILPHCVDGTVHIQELSSKIFFQISFFSFALLIDILSNVVCYVFPATRNITMGESTNKFSSETRLYFCLCQKEGY
jgi:hypothetical protein